MGKFKVAYNFPDLFPHSQEEEWEFQKKNILTFSTLIFTVMFLAKILLGKIYVINCGIEITNIFYIG